MTVENAYVLVFRSDHFITSRKKNTNLKKKIVFFKTMVGTFCATCTVIDHPC